MKELDERLVKIEQCARSQRINIQLMDTIHRLAGECRALLRGEPVPRLEEDDTHG